MQREAEAADPGVRSSAARSVAMLAGFLAVAWLQVAAVLLAVWLVLELLPGTLALQVAVPLVIAAAGLLWWATVRALRLRRPAPAGVPVLREHAPALWSMLDEAAAAAGVKPPDGVTVVAGAGATLSERLRLGGLLGGRRELYLGLPLLQAWDESRLRAVVAHELAHGSPALGGRFAPAARRGRVALGRIVPRIPARSPAGPLLRAWARWYRSVDTPHSRAQELAADRVAASFAGPRAAAAVLRDGPALEGMQQLFHAEYLSPGWQTGLVPDDIFGGFLRVLAARPDDVARLRARDPEPPGEWDPHPPLSERLAALAAVTPEGPEPPERPAGDLVPDLPGLGRALQAVAFPVGGRAVVGWDEFFGVARLAEMEREADASLRALSHAAGSPVTGAAEVLDLAADGRLRKIAETVFGDLPPEEVSARVTDLIGLLLALAALHSGVARWRHSWTGTAELVAIDGSYLELQAPAEMAGDPATVERAREWLTSLGIDLTARAGATRHHSARVPVLGGVVGVQVDGARTDLLVLETGFVLLPALPRSRHHEAKRRLTRLAAEGVLPDGSPAGATGAPADTSAPIGSGDPSADAPVAVGAPAAAGGSVGAGEAVGAGKTATATLTETAGHRFVPFADVATASATRNGRRSWEISLRDGGTLTVRTTLDSEELPGGWAALDDAVAFLTRTR
ncbi:peptidase [Actinoplanes sp. URMC 104]|uniref:peptidase n=1 Tax=Actinoplanes sp. URMC 104 TaxID=3423409 RepID=UPI003F1AAF9D